jgi:dTDP-4-dehydrorhamnose reductase
MGTELEVWAGIECTVNRIGEKYFDQLRRNGHAGRIEDLERIAALGIRTVRYPVLWESVAPQGIDKANWSWVDERLGKLRELGIRPIAGLCHHGSGPRHTNLLKRSFIGGLEEFAHAVAERYPWIEAYTPVNEPLTTARFSALYGIWYPHIRDDASFLRAVVTQCLATVAAMRAVRSVNAAAKLIQTEDFGRTTSTPALAYQAEHEAQRRFVSIDLLAGRVGPQHPLYGFLVDHGVDANDLAYFRDHSCTPDVIGINYYVTSDRFLDEHVGGYPKCYHGGNGRHAYADVEAVRVAGQSLTGHLELLRTLWQRYRIPLAITEVHLGSSREEQLRWFLEAYRAAKLARDEKINIRSVTLWALFGSFDWNTLVTSDAGHYEPGAFDVRAPAPRPTALAMMLRGLVDGRQPDHPVLDVPGWWRRPERILYPGDAPRPVVTAVENNAPQKAPRSILMTGASGTLGAAFGRIAAARGLACQLVTRHEMDIANPGSVQRMLDEVSPWAVINAAGYVRVDDAEHEPERCARENVLGPSVLARACRERSIRMVTFSSDLVFDGAQGRPYVESDGVSPLGIYGKTKALAERLITETNPDVLVIRTAAFFGPWDEHNFVFKALRALSTHGSFVAAEDSIVSPTYVPDLVHTALDLLIDGESGLWHVVNQGAVSWLELARLSADIAGMDTTRLVGCSSSAFGHKAPRPAYCVLGSERAILLPSLGDSLTRFITERTIPFARDGAARGRGTCASW